MHLFLHIKRYLMLTFHTFWCNKKPEAKTIHSIYTGAMWCKELTWTSRRCGEALSFIWKWRNWQIFNPYNLDGYMCRGSVEKDPNVIWVKLLGVHLILGHRWSLPAQWTSSSFELSSFHARWWIGQAVPPISFKSHIKIPDQALNRSLTQE